MISIASIIGKIRETISPYFFKSPIDGHYRHVLNLAAKEEALPAAEVRQRPDGPVISFVAPVYNAAPDHLDDLLNSIRRQPAGWCELVLSDDGSTALQTRRWLDGHRGEENMVVVRNDENRGIAAATNAGIAQARGEWVGLIDQDDALSPGAVSQILRVFDAEPECKFLYTDEVVADSRLHPVDYFFKPSWDPVLLSGVNYVNHLSLFRRDRLIEVGSLREGYDGSQDYDLLLRYLDGLEDREILHLPYPAYLWRRHRVSFSEQNLDVATQRARRALFEHYGRDHPRVEVDHAISDDLHRVRFDVGRDHWPTVSIVIPSKNAFPLISRLLTALTKDTDYPNFEIIVVDNGSTDPATLALYERHRAGPIEFRVDIHEEPFNFSRAINRGVSMAKGQHILLLNNDIEVLEPGWLKEMVSCFAYPQVGIVGAKLLYQDRTIQHVGVIAGLGGLAGHWFIGRDRNFPGPMGRLWVRQSLSVVTGACMLVSKECFHQVGLFDEEAFPIAYNDVDFCLRAIGKGFRVVWTPFASLVHHESASRGSDETKENIARFNRDKRSLRERHRTDTFEDRAFSPWYAKDHSDPAPAFLQQLPRRR